ncbi:MAG: putative DNA-binding domain-containing protein [Rhizobiales bacterium]|nr:putative DNA-binding domain-containing protein [Hyphomicrobiales bacterium]MBI3674373.1 putative DNA-binding domain-containing protein [Hyphomicrobiales bacterium]
MPRLADRQREFGSALLDPARPLPWGLVGPDGEPSLRRFSVYRNNVVVGLIDALKDAFPAVHRIVGDEFFKGLAHAYVVQEPPASPILLDYGAGFPSFIGKFEPAAVLPYLPDVARIERAWMEAYHAPEAASLDLAGLTALAPDDFIDIGFSLHPSLRIVRSPFPALTIWRMNTGDDEPALVDLASGGEDALIVRPAAEVEVRRMPPGGAEFVEQLAAEASVGEALRAAARCDEEFDLAANLAGLFEAGALTGWRLKAQMTDGKAA